MCHPHKKDESWFKCCQVCTLRVTDYLQSRRRKKKCCTLRQSKRNERIECDHTLNENETVCFVWNCLLNSYEIMECNPINLNVFRSLLCSFWRACRFVNFYLGKTTALWLSQIVIDLREAKHGCARQRKSHSTKCNGLYGISSRIQPNPYKSPFEKAFV